MISTLDGTFQVYTPTFYRFIEGEPLKETNEKTDKDTHFFRVVFHIHQLSPITRYVSEYLLEKALENQVFSLNHQGKEYKLQFRQKFSLTRETIFKFFSHPRINAAALTNPLANPNLLSIILKHVNLEDLPSTLQVCHLWKRASLEESVWVDHLSKEPLHSLYTIKQMVCDNGYIPKPSWIKEAIKQKKELEGQFWVDPKYPLTLGEAAPHFQKQGYRVEEDTQFFYVTITDPHLPEDSTFTWTEIGIEKKLGFVAPLALPQDLIKNGLEGNIRFKWQEKILNLSFSQKKDTLSKSQILKILANKTSEPFEDSTVSEKDDTFYKTTHYLPKLTSV